MFTDFSLVILFRPFCCPRCLPPHCSPSFQQQARPYGAPRFKPSMLMTKPKRTPSMLALDNFDFYYAPLFGKKWPSIRLGLLTSNKFAAVVNRYSQSFEANREIISSLGTINLIEHLTGGEEPAENVIRLKHQFDEQLCPLGAKRSFGNQEAAEERGSSESEKIVDLNSRLESGMNQFLPPIREIRHDTSVAMAGERGQGEEGSNARNVINDRKLKVTGLEWVGADAETLPTVDDIPIYPRELQLFIHPAMSIEGFPGPIRDRMNISSWWLLDGGSILPVLALDLKEDDNVLDMCASPGGKSLMITQTNKFATLVCNDIKLQRLGQLRHSLGMYIPAESDVFPRIIIKRKDAASVESWDDIDLYDKVLADVPCTTDRHSANQDVGNVFATERSTERLDIPNMQTKILINALRSVRVGGSVVYSTCSLAPTQNEVVVENAAILAKQHYGIECVERSLKRMEGQLGETGLYHFSEQQRRGTLVLPHVISNFGPMYICKLQRTR